MQILKHKIRCCWELHAAMLMACGKMLHCCYYGDGLSPLYNRIVVYCSKHPTHKNSHQSVKVSADQAPPAVVEQYSDSCANEATNLAQSIPVQLVPEVFSSVMSNESESVPHANLNDPFIRSMNWKCYPSAEEAKTWNAPDELSSTPTSQCSDGVLSILENSMTAVKGNSITPRLPDLDGALSISCAALPSFLVRERIEIAQKRHYLAEAVAAGLGGSKTIFASIPMPAILPDPDDGPCAITDSDRLRVSRSRINQAQQRMHARIQNAAQRK
jgi:hypothetical protein